MSAERNSFGFLNGDAVEGSQIQEDLLERSEQDSDIPFPEGTSVMNYPTFHRGMEQMAAQGEISQEGDAVIYQGPEGTFELYADFDEDSGRVEVHAAKQVNDYGKNTEITDLLNGEGGEDEVYRFD